MGASLSGGLELAGGGERARASGDSSTCGAGALPALGEIQVPGVRQESGGVRTRFPPHVHRGQS